MRTNSQNNPATRRVTLLIINSQGQVYLTTDKKGRLKLPSISYQCSLDPWDFFAAARYLYQVENNITISEETQYLDILKTETYKNFLGIVNQADVLLSDNMGKVLKLTYDFQNSSNFTLMASEHLPLTLERPLDKLILNCGDRNQKIQVCQLNPSPTANSTLRNIEEALHRGFHQEPHEVWTTFKVACGEIPTKEQLSQFDIVLINGSCASVYDKTITWIEPLKELIRYCHSRGIRLYGVCFGHQIIAEALGGMVQRMPDIKQQLRGRRTVHQQILLDGDVHEMLNVNFAHGDYVARLPNKTFKLFSADHCQIVGYQGLNVLGLQFHPEYNKLILKYLALKDNQDHQFDDIDQSFSVGRDDGQLWQQITLRYVKAGVPVQLNDSSISPAQSP